jgi:hypothetical protein
MSTLSLTTTSHRPNLRKASGEQLLLLAVFGPKNLKQKIDDELDRRALSVAAGGTGVVPHPATMFSSYSGHAA